MSFLKWLAAGIVGAAVGGAAWVLIGHFANYEVGWIAWGIGFLAGAAVRTVAGDARGPAPGLAAVAAAAAGVAVSKYVVVALAVNQMLGQMQGLELAGLDDFRSAAFAESFTPWDLLWFGLAMFTAFRVGSGLDAGPQTVKRDELPKDETPKAE